MRWPLRNKILVRLILLLIGTIAVITIANLNIVTSASNRMLEDRIQRIATLVTTSNFPLTSNVLDNMSQLTGAEFAVVDQNGRLISKSSRLPDFQSWSTMRSLIPGQVDLENSVTLNGESYVHTIIQLTGRKTGSPQEHELLVHVFVNLDIFREIWQRSASMPLIVAATVTPITFLIGLALANYVTRPLRELQAQVKSIAAGDLTAGKRIKGNDEISDLQESVNELVNKLKDHDEQLRQNERLSTLIQMGSGIAHNLKNCVTGCKMAVELLAAEETSGDTSVNTQVALRQLLLMNSYIDKFLLFGHPLDNPPQKAIENVDLVCALDSAFFLLSPTVKHLGVELTRQLDVVKVEVAIDRDDVDQMMLNLITNAVEAASIYATSHPEKTGVVHVQLKNTRQIVEFSVTDNGAGPPSEIADSIMNPFVSGKKEGVGLGLTLVNEIVKNAGGEFSWNRLDGETCFQVKLAAIRK